MGGKNGRIAPAIRGVAVSCVKRSCCHARRRGEKRASGMKTGPNRGLLDDGGKLARTA